MFDFDGFVDSVKYLSILLVAVLILGVIFL